MYCSKCGNKLKDGELFCSKCGKEIDKERVNEEVDESIQKINQNEIDNEDNKVTKKKFKLRWLILILLITSATIIFILNKNNTFDNNKIADILKSSSNGVYLQNQTVKLGEITDINYRGYNKLISYSAVYVHNEVTLKAGGFILYNTLNKEYYIIDNLQTDFISIIYYLNTQNMNNQLAKVNEITTRYIQKYGNEIFSDDKFDEEYAQMGKEIGKIVGVDLCRKIGEKGMHELTNYNYNVTFLYRKGEIFIRYIGMNVTSQQYAWQGIIDETSAKLIYNNNYKSYKNLVAIYGEPYKNVTKFVVFNYVDDMTNEIGTYNSLEDAKKELNLEQSSDKAEIENKNDNFSSNNIESTYRIKIDINKFITELAEEYSITGNNGAAAIYRFNTR